MKTIRSKNSMNYKEIKKLAREMRKYERFEKRAKRHEQKAVKAHQNAEKARQNAKYVGMTRKEIKEHVFSEELDAEINEINEKED